jgi:hypothetical protein
VPFSPSDFAWWMWLLFAVGALVISAFSWLIAVNDEPETKLFRIPCGILAAIVSLTGTLALLIGIIRFVKWVWGD